MNLHDYLDRRLPEGFREFLRKATSVDAGGRWITMHGTHVHIGGPSTTVYHGTTISELAGGRRLRSGERANAKSLPALARGAFTENVAGLYVAPTPELAARYANARATGQVSKDATTPGKHTVVLAIDTPDDVKWRRRPAAHPTLDEAEGNITRGHVRIHSMQECDYANCECHDDAARIRRQLSISKSMSADRGSPLGEALHKAALPPGRRWITVHPNGKDEKGIPILIEENPSSPGIYSVVAGAGGKLNHLQLTGIKSEKEYRERAALNRKDKEAKKEEKKAEMIARGETPNAKDFVSGKDAKRAQERQFINQVAALAGWDLSPLERWDDPEAIAEELGIEPGAARIDAARAHKSYLSAAKKTAGDIKNRVLNDAEARQQAGLSNEVPLHVADQDPNDVQAKEDLVSGEEKTLAEHREQVTAKATMLDAEEHARTAAAEEEKRAVEIMTEAHAKAVEAIKSASSPADAAAAKERAEATAELAAKAQARAAEHAARLSDVEKEKAALDEQRATLDGAQKGLEEQRASLEEMKKKGSQIGMTDLVKQPKGTGMGYAKETKERAVKTAKEEQGTALSKLADEAKLLIEEAANVEAPGMEGWFTPNANAILNHLRTAKGALEAGDEEALSGAIVQARRQMLKLQTRVDYKTTKENPAASLAASLAMEDRMASLQAQAKIATAEAPTKAAVDPRVADMRAAKQILLAEKAMRAALSKVEKDTDPFDMVERKWLDAQAVDMEELTHQVADELDMQLQADLNSSFMHEVSHSETLGSATGFSPEEQRAALARHIGVGSYAAIDTLAHVATGQSLISRDVLDTFGVGPAVSLVARKLAATLDKDELASVIAGLEAHHAQRNDEDVQQAMDQARAAYDTINDLDDGQLEHPDDILLAQQNNELRKAAIRDAQTALGTAWGSLSTEAALIWQLKKTRAGEPVTSFSARFSDDLDPASIVRQVKALGLQEGDYGLKRENGQTSLMVVGAGMDRLFAPPLSKTERALRSEIMAIRAGAQDEQGWLPHGIKSRPATTFTAPDAVLSRYGRPFSPQSYRGMFPDPAGLKDELETYVGSRLADGEHWGDVAKDITSTAFLAEHGLESGGEPDAEYLAMAHDMFSWEDSAFQAEHNVAGKRQTFAAARKAMQADNEQRATRYAQAYMDRYRAKTGDTAAEAVNAQSIGEPSEGIVDAIHRTMAAEPLLKPAFSGAPLNPADSEAVRLYYYKHILKQPPPAREPQGIQDAEDPDGLVVPPSVNKEAAQEETALQSLFGMDEMQSAGTLAGAEGGMLKITNSKGEEIGQVNEAELRRENRERTGGPESASSKMGIGAPVAAASTRSPWADYVSVHGDTHRAQQTVLAHMRGQAAEAFSRHYAMITGEPLRVGRSALPHSEVHAKAARNPGRARLELDAERKRAEAQVASRQAGGQFAQGARGEVARQMKASVQAGQHMLAAANATAEDLELTSRPTIGERAEHELASLWPQVSDGFDPKAPVSINRETRMDGQTITQQRYVKAICKAKRMGVFAGVGSGKSLISIGAFTELHSQGKVKRALFQVPSAVQAQFGSEMLKYTDPGKYKWFAHPGANFASRVAAYRDPGRHMVVVTHQSFRDDMMRLYAKRAGMSMSQAVTAFDGMSEEERTAALGETMDAEGIHFDMHVADEAHEALNRRGKANSTLANVHDAMSARSPYYIGLTGTPVKNDASEAYDWLHKLAPGQYSDRAAFLKRFGVNTSASKEALQREVSRHFYASRVPLTVSATHQTRQLDLSPEQQKAYNGVMADVGTVRAARSRGEVDVETLKKLSPESFAHAPEEQHQKIAASLASSLGMIREGALARVVNGFQHQHNAKIQAVVKDALAQKAKGQPGIVFSHNRGPVRQLKRALTDAGLRVMTISGSDSAQAKAQKKAAYIRGEADVLIGTDAIESGMDLSAAKWVGHLDIPDTYKRYEQRTARAHRLGQDRDVAVYDYVSNTQHDASRARRLKTKQGLAGVFQSPAEGLDDTGLALQIAKARAMRVQRAATGEAPPAAAPAPEPEQPTATPHDDIVPTEHHLPGPDPEDARAQMEAAGASSLFG